MQAYHHIHYLLMPNSAETIQLCSIGLTERK
jgi:hypothetical protein